jgi:DNA-binding NarL/FixJ family response regulator
MVEADTRRVVGAALAAGGDLAGAQEELRRAKALGHSNRQIATKLALSPKTEESHPSRALAKLDVSCRTALAHKIGTSPGT